MLVQWGKQKSKIIEKKDEPISEKNPLQEKKKIEKGIQIKEKDVVCNHVKHDQPKIEDSPSSIKKNNQTLSFREKLIIPKWHIFDQDVKKTDSYLLKFPDAYGLHFADILIITEDATSPIELQNIEYATEQLLKSNIHTYQQKVGPKRGYVVPFSFLFLIPEKQKNQVAWPSLNHTIFVDWITFSEKAESRKLLWAEICFFLNKRAQLCTSISMPKLL